MITFSMFMQLLLMIAVLTIGVMVIAYIIKFPSKLHRKWKEQRLFKYGITDTDNMTGEEFEIWLKATFEKLGYEVKLTSRTGDGGADLILINPNGKKIAVQAKQSSKYTIGVKAVSEVMRGQKVHNCDEAWVVANQKFGKQALSDGRKCGVKMIDRNELLGIREKIATREQVKKDKLKAAK